MKFVKIQNFTQMNLNFRKFINFKFRHLFKVVDD